MDYSNQYNGLLAAAYAEQASSHAKDDLGRAFLKERLSLQNRQDIIVDVGCGSGLDLITYNQMGFPNLFGLDPSLSFAESAKQSLHGKAHILCGKFEHLPFRKQSIDTVTSRFSLMYCESIGAVFAEVARILKPGGLFAAVVSHPLRDARLPQNLDGTIAVTFFNGAVTTKYPRHTENDYIGLSFQKYFEQISKKEFSDRASAGYVNPEILAAPAHEPTVLCFSGMRKALAENTI